MDREASLLQELAERPDDRALRLVFSDWLQEQGDARGEVIALGARGQLSLTERRRVARVTAANLERWLGPLAAVADLHGTRFSGGFLDELVCAPGRGPRPYATLVGEPRLATARALVVPATQGSARLGDFLSSRVLRGLRRLELGSTDWQALAGRAFPLLAPPQVVVGSWGVFEKELAPLAGVPLFQQGRALGLSTTEFINPVVVEELLEQVLAQHAALTAFARVTLKARYGVLEGAAAWLLACERHAASLDGLFRGLEGWGVESGDVVFTRTRGERGRFDHLEIDLAAPEAPGERRAASSRSAAEVRIATAASVLVLLGPARLVAVSVRLPEGGGLRAHERHALQAAARRSGSLERFTIGGDAVLP